MSKISKIFETFIKCLWLKKEKKISATVPTPTLKSCLKNKLNGADSYSAGPILKFIRRPKSTRE
jgi:hypothetical protein